METGGITALLHPPRLPSQPTRRISLSFEMSSVIYINPDRHPRNDRHTRRRSIIGDFSVKVSPLWSLPQGPDPGGQGGVPPEEEVRAPCLHPDWTNINNTCVRAFLCRKKSETISPHQDRFYPSFRIVFENADRRTERNLSDTKGTQPWRGEDFYICHG